MGDSMSSVIISGDTSGAITLSAPAVSGTNTATLPAATGTVMVSGNMPAFSAYATTTQSLTQNTYTKVTFGTEEFDTNNNFASSRFTPTVAGYYQLSSTINFGGAGAAQYAIAVIYKNGSYFKGLCQNVFTTAFTLGGSSLVYANGTTDYFEIYAYTGQTGIALYGDSSSGYTWFNGCMVRSA